MGKVKNLALTGLALLALGIGVSGCAFPPGSYYRVDENGKKHRIYLEDLQQPSFKGIVCNTIIKNADGTYSFEGGEKVNFFQHERIVVGQEACYLLDDLTIRTTVTNEIGDTVYHVGDFFGKNKECCTTWDEFEPYGLKTGIYTVRWTDIIGGELDKEKFVVREEER